MTRLTFIKSVFASLFAFVPFIGSKAKVVEARKMLVFLIDTSASMTILKSQTAEIIDQILIEAPEGAMATFLTLDRIQVWPIPIRLLSPFDICNIVDSCYSEYVSKWAFMQTASNTSEATLNNIKRLELKQPGFKPYIIYLTDGMFSDIHINGYEIDETINVFK